MAGLPTRAGYLSGHCADRETPRLTPPLSKLPGMVWLIASFSLLVPGRAGATDVKPETIAGFNRYISATEAQMTQNEGPDRFLIVDRLPEPQRRDAYDLLHRGEVYIEELHTQQDHHSISVPDGLVHDWAGVIFIRNADLGKTDDVLRRYNDQAEIYGPDVRQAKLIERDGNHCKIFEQFYSKSIVTVVLNSYFDVVETRISDSRIQSVSRSTRIAEVLDFGSASEHERTDGKDHGYMWRLNSYWRLEEKDGGVYVQVESVSLSRTMPALLAWLISPYTKSIPRDVLIRTLTNTRKAVEMPRTASN